MHPPTPRFALLRSVIIGVIALVAPLSAGRAQQLDPDQWGANGTVSAMAASGDTVFLGGDFSLIGPVSGGGGELSLRDGRPTPNFPRVTGTIRAALPDGQGGWFVGGTFSALEGVPRTNLAHVLADGHVAAWDPNVVGVPGRVIAYPIDRSNQIEVVSALVRDGNLLYVGGTFSQVAGQPRPGLAAVDVHTGRLESWAPDPDGVVTSLAIERRRLYVGGSFTHVAGAARARLAAFELRSGTLTRWNPGASDAVFCLEATDKVVFVGGDFDSVGGRARNSLAAIDPVTGAVAEWDARLGPRRQVLPQLNFVWPWVGALAIQDHRLVVGGFFESFGGTPRHDLAMLDQGTADPTPFDPEPDGYIYSLFVQGPELLVGGEFNHIGGATQPFAAELRLPGGEATAWSPTLGGPAFLVRPAARDVLVGGAFAQIQPWAHRHGLAALDAPTGRLLDWDPETDGYVLTLLIDGGRLFAGGNFGLVAGQPRHHLASFATGTGALEDWVPGVSEVVRTLAARGPSIFVGGDFHSVDGQLIPDLAAVDRDSGHALAWRADWLDVFRIVTALAVHGDHLYVGGPLYAHNPDFSMIRNFLVDVSATTGAWGAWNPVAGPPFSTDYQIDTMVAQDGRVFVAGSFHELGGAARNGLAAVDTLTGHTTAWDPDGGAPPVDAREIQALLALPDRVLVGGLFSQIGGQPRTDLASLDPVTGAVQPWSPRLDGGVTSLCVAGRRLYLGGTTMAEGFPRVGLTAYRLETAPATNAIAAVATGGGSMLSIHLTPSSVSSRATLAFRLAAAADVSLEVFDVQGRRVATPLPQQTLPAGEHSVDLRVDGWSAGVYFCRFTASGASLTRRLLVDR